MNELDKFLLGRTHRYPAARTKLMEFRSVFLASLLPREQRLWSRARLISELAARQFPVGRDHTGTLCVGELSLTPPPRYEVQGGRLKLAA